MSPIFCFNNPNGGELMDLLLLFLAFCGGAFGAMIGGLASFALCGVFVLVAMVPAMSGVSFDYLITIPFGFVFAPHISFVGAVAASGYAKRMGYLASGKDIVTGLMSLRKPSIIMVGGVFGIMGYLLGLWFAQVLTGKLDTVALTVVTLSLIIKFVFDSKLNFRGIIGTVSEDTKSAGGRYAFRSKDTWLPYVASPAEITIVAIVAGGLSAYVTQVMLQNPATEGVALFFGFGLGGALLLLLQFGVAIPVTHHIALVASYAVSASGGDIWWGIAAAIAAAFLGDILAKTFYIYGDTHVDPPSMAIASGSLLVFTIIPWTGMYEQNSSLIPITFIGIVILFCTIQSFRNVKGINSLEVETVKVEMEIKK